MKANEEAREALLEEVAGLSDEAINKKPAEDEWSIKQVLEHLYLFEIDVVESVKTELARGEKVEVEEKPIHLSTNRKMKFEAPDNMKPTESYMTLEELKRNLSASRKKLERFVENADERQLEEKALPHPGFKVLSLAQWIEFIGWHEQRHILQIKEVKEKLGL